MFARLSDKHSFVTLDGLEYSRAFSCIRQHIQVDGIWPGGRKLPIRFDKLLGDLTSWGRR
jgi:hypothetical protein